MKGALLERGKAREVEPEGLGRGNPHFYGLSVLSLDAGGFLGT